MTGELAPLLFAKPLWHSAPHILLYVGRIAPEHPRKARKVLTAIQGETGVKEIIAEEKIGKLSIVGVGMRSHSGVAARMFEALAQAGVNIDMISTSEIKISVVIDLARGDQAVKAVHAAFLG